MSKPKDHLSGILRRAILESGMALIAIERETGVQRMSIARFLEGRTSLRLDKAGILADYFGLKLNREGEAK